jgi:hypothetical protein
MEQIQAILKGLKALCMLVIVGILVCAMIASCATTTTVQPVRRGLHSNIADIWLPEGATLDPSSNSKLEMWHASAPLGTTTQEMNSLLPVNQPLDGLPWCGSTTAGNPTSTSWAWGSSTDMVSVGVSEITGKVMIAIWHGPPTHGACQPG